MANLPVVREENAFELGKVFAESGMFPNVRKAAEAVVKIVAGREFGLGPMAAMNGIHMVDGKPTLAANLIAGQIKRSPKYDYTVRRREDTGCTLEFFEVGPGRPQANGYNPVVRTSLGTMTWDEKDAKAAGLLGKRNWKFYPRDMYFARCLTSGARTYCPDVLGGSPIYTAEELGAEEAAQAPTEAPEPTSPTPDVPDAEVVADDEPQTVDTDVLAQLRVTYNESGKTEDELAWFLLSVGVESLPENPSREDIGNTMRGLTLEQALKLDELLKGNDDAVPGSGEAA